MNTEVSIDPDVYTVQDLTQILDCSLNTAYKAVRQNIIPSFRIGWRYYIPRVALDELLSCKTQIAKLREKLEPERPEPPASMPSQET